MAHLQRILAAPLLLAASLFLIASPPPAGAQGLQPTAGASQSKRIERKPGQIRSAQILTPDRVFEQWEQAWAAEDAEALQQLLVTADISLRMSVEPEDGKSAETYSRGQVFYMLEALFEDVEVVSTEVRRWALAEDGSTAHALLETEWIADDADAAESRRLFVRARRIEEGWRVFEVRALP